VLRRKPKAILMPLGWTFDDLIVWAHRPELFDVEPRIIEALPELDEATQADLDGLGSPEEFLAWLKAEAKEIDHAS
jgi:hypothetical protein